MWLKSDPKRRCGVVWHRSMSWKSSQDFNNPEMLFSRPRKIKDSSTYSLENCYVNLSWNLKSPRSVWRDTARWRRERVKLRMNEKNWYFLDNEEKLREDQNPWWTHILTAEALLNTSQSFLMLSSAQFTWLWFASLRSVSWYMLGSKSRNVEDKEKWNEDWMRNDLWIKNWIWVNRVHEYVLSSPQCQLRVTSAHLTLIAVSLTENFLSSHPTKPTVKLKCKLNVTLL